MLVIASDKTIARSLRAYGEWSEHEIDGLSHYIRDDTLALDVGANVGTHSLAFARRKPGARVWGFEPQPLVSAVAATNCARNGGANAAILPMACGRDYGEIVLGPPLALEANVGAFSLAAAPDLQPKPRASRLQSAWKRLVGERRAEAPEPTPPLMRVRVVPLDAFAFPQPVSLIKIDVEGMEPAVLAGARGTLERHRPTVYFEALSTKDLEEPRALLAGLGYRLFWMETHQFNRANHRGEAKNLWWRTEMGVLALPPGVAAHAPLPELDHIPEDLPYRENAREGITVGDPGGPRNMIADAEGNP